MGGGGGGTCWKLISQLEKKLVCLGHKPPCATVGPGFCLLQAITSAPCNLNKEETEHQTFRNLRDQSESSIRLALVTSEKSLFQSRKHRRRKEKTDERPFLRTVMLTGWTHVKAHPANTLNPTPFLFSSALLWQEGIICNQTLLMSASKLLESTAKCPFFPIIVICQLGSLTIPTNLGTNSLKGKTTTIFQLTETNTA